MLVVIFADSPRDLRCLPFLRILVPGSAGAQRVGRHVAEPAATAGATDPHDGADGVARGSNLKRERVVDATAASNCPPVLTLQPALQ